MRVTGGELRGRRLEAPAGHGVRPTSERLRAALFDMLAHAAWAPEGGAVPGARVADIFAGTGAIGIEALSRGAAEAVFVESDRAALRALERNLAALGLEDRARIIRADALAAPAASAACDLIFLDPPYGRDLAWRALASLARTGWAREGSLAVVELGRRDSAGPPEGWSVLDDRTRGDTRIIVASRRQMVALDDL